MAKTESTAVNQLIDLVQNSKPVTAEPANDLFAAPKSTKASPVASTIPAMRGAGEVAPLPRGRAPQSTSNHALPALPALPAPVRMTTAPEPRGTTIPPLSRPTSRASLPPPRNTPRATLPPTAPVAAPFESMRPGERAIPQQFPIVQPPDMRVGDSWFEVNAPIPSGILDEGTAQVARRNETLAIVAKLAIPTVLLTVLMVVGYFAFYGPKKPVGTKPVATVPGIAPAAATPAPTAPSTEEMARAQLPSPESANAGTASAGGEQPQPPPKAEQLPPSAEELAKREAAALADEPAMTRDAPATAVKSVDAAAPAVAPAPAITEVKTLRGVVKLVDVRINSKPAGATVMLVDNGKTSFLGTTPIATSVDSSRSYDVIITLEGRHTQMAHLDPTKTSHLDVRLSRASSSSKAETTSAPAAEKVEKAVAKPEKKVAAAEPAGEGTLMVSSKPPCEIHIDGKATGLTTPQRSIPLPAGTHKVTFVNAAEGIKKTVSVSISADQSTKLIQDLMKK